MNNKLILRSLESPFSDITKNSKLTIADGDNNFIFLKGSDLSAATTTGTVLSLIKNNGEIINVDISSVSGGTGQNTAIVSGTFSNETLTLYNTTGGTVVVTGITSSGSSGAEVFVTGGTANNNIKTYTFTNNTGGTFTVNALTDIYLSNANYSNGILSLINNTGGTITVSGFTTGITSTDTYITGATVNNNNKTYTFINNTGGTFTLNGLTDITIVSGVYNSGTLILTNSTGGTISITGLTASAGTDTYITGATTNNNNKTYTFTTNTNNSFVVNGLTDITITSGIYSGSTLILNNNTGGTVVITGITSNLSQEVYVTGGTGNNNNKTYTFTNTTGGTFVLSALTDITITGGSITGQGLVLNNNTGGTIVVSGVATTTISTVGNIINEQFNNLSNFTQVGTAFTANSGSLIVNNTVGSISFASYIKQTAYGNSDLEQTTMQASFVIPAISATSFGVGLGYKSNGTLYANSLCVCFLTNTTNAGKIAFYFNEQTSGAVVGSSKITISSGDVTTIKVSQLKDRIVATWKNGTQEITETYVYQTVIGLINPTIVTVLPNSYNYSIYALGGNYSLSAFTVNNNHIKSPSLLVIGDSITKGYNGGINNRPADILARNYLYSSSVIANANVKIEEINSTEVLSLTPTSILIALGTNNKGGGDSDATIMSKLNTLVSTLVTAGYVVGLTLFIETLRPRITYDVNGVNALIRAAFPTGFVEMYYPLWLGSSFTMDPKYAAYDGLHMTEFGFQKEADVIIQKLGLQPKTDIVLLYKNVQQTEQGNVGVGVGNTNIGRFPIDAYRVGTQGRFGNTYYTQTTGGMFITALGDASGLISAGIDTVDGTNWVARSTTYGAVGFSNGSIFFYCATGVTKDSGIAPSIKAVMTSNGSLYLGGSNITPNSTLQVGGSISAAYVAKTANYTLTSTDYVVDCTANSFTITLPSAVGITGRMYTIKNTGSATTITVATTLSQTIDGTTASTITNLTPYRLMSTGANWISV